MKFGRDLHCLSRAIEQRDQPLMQRAVERATTTFLEQQHTSARQREGLKSRLQLRWLCSGQN